VIIREDGYLLTNSHVVEGAEKIVVKLQDGTEYDKVEVKGVDSHSDVAVLKIDAKGLPAASWLIPPARESANLPSPSARRMSWRTA